MTQTWALKEWSLALRALGEGEQVVLLRKGGIVEETGEFDVVSRQFVLYPTFYHQEPGILKPQYQAWLDSESTEAPDRIEIGLYAEVSDSVPLSDPEVIPRLTGHHIWSTDYVTDRFYWKPDKPLTALILRVYRLGDPVTIDVRPEYGGCRSWIQLADPVDVSTCSPVLNDDSFARIRAGILDAATIAAG